MKQELKSRLLQIRTTPTVQKLAQECAGMETRTLTNYVEALIVRDAESKGLVTGYAKATRGGQKTRDGA
jgi:hypothetical protein